MHDLAVLLERSKHKAQQEYDDACDEGNFDLANQIYEANPDIRPLWLRNPNPDTPDENPWEDHGGEA